MGDREQPSTGHAARRDDSDDLDVFVKDVVDALPPLTEEQRDLLALIFRTQRYR